MADPRYAGSRSSRPMSASPRRTVPGASRTARVRRRRGFSDHHRPPGSKAASTAVSVNARRTRDFGEGRVVARAVRRGSRMKRTDIVHRLARHFASSSSRSIGTGRRVPQGWCCARHFSPRTVDSHRGYIVPREAVPARQAGAIMCLRGGRGEDGGGRCRAWRCRARGRVHAQDQHAAFRLRRLGDGVLDQPSSWRGRSGRRSRRTSTVSTV